MLFFRNCRHSSEVQTGFTQLTGRNEVNSWVLISSSGQSNDLGLRFGLSSLPETESGV